MAKDPRKLRVSVVREEFYALTKNALSARIIDQFLYWSERVRDYDKFLQEEKTRASADGRIVDATPTNGWIYKKVSDLKAEVMADESEATVRRRLQELVAKGVLHERTNPNHYWDKTLQYRVDILALMKMLKEIGYELQGWTLNDEIESSNLHGEDSETHGEGAIPEITIETKKKKKHIVESPKPNIQRQQDPMFNAIRDTLGIINHERIGLIKSIMLGTSTNSRYTSCNFETPANAEEVISFGKWYANKYPRASLPHDPVKIQNHFHAFRQQHKPKSRIHNGRYQEYFEGMGWTDVYGVANAQ